MENKDDEFQILGYNAAGLEVKHATPRINAITDEVGDIVFDLPQDKTTNIIKVIGVGGGGGNAVKNMYEQGVTNVSFAVCNTDSQALSKSPIPMKVQLGPEGLGVGGNPELGRKEAEESKEDIERMLGKETQMLFLTAGMGGGTGTGAAPVIARMARERGILTVGVVTLPFAFEKRQRCEKALLGVERLKKEVDSLLVINNERLLQMFEGEGGIPIEEAFRKADSVLTTATKSIAEIITLEGKINRDFNDVKTVMKDGGSAIMSVGYGEGDNRIIKAMEQALKSPLLNRVDVPKAKKLLYIIYTCKDAPVMTNELTLVNKFMDTLNDDLEVLWGLYEDDSIGNQVKVAIVATGFDTPDEEKKDGEKEEKEIIKQLKDYYYSNNGVEEEQTKEPEPEPEPIDNSEVQESADTQEELSEPEEPEDFDEPEEHGTKEPKKKSFLEKLRDWIEESLNED